jgi:hypothetical protein
MELLLIYLGIYFIGCLLAMLFFLLGPATILTTRNWFWPVIFLWPLLALWPVYASAEWFLKTKARKYRQSEKFKIL